MSQLAQIAPDAPGRDEGLRCLRCDYNLTGVPSQTCPECGKRFSPMRVRAIARGEAWQRIPIWSARRPGGGAGSYVATIGYLAFHPIRYAKALTRYPHERDARLFRMASHFLALGAFALMCAAVAFYSSVPVAILLPLVVWVCVRLCELGLWLLWRVIVSPHPRAGSYAVVLTCLTSWHSILSALTAGVAFLIVMDGPGDGLVWLFFAGCLLTWWVHILLMAWSVTRRATAVIFMAFFVPVCAAVSIALGFFVSVLGAMIVR